MQIRQACATAREALLGRRRKQARRRKAIADGRDGVVEPRSGGKGLSYAELVGGNDFRLNVDAKAPLKDPKDYTIVGKPVPRLDIPAKVFGSFKFVQDVPVQGMVHARVVRPTAHEGDAPSWSDATAARSPATSACAKKGNFLAVLAPTEWAAIKASRTDRRQVDRLGGPARQGEAVGMRAQLEACPRRGPAEGGRQRGGAQGAGREVARRLTTSR